MTMKKYLIGEELNLFCLGINQFNQRKFFDCHETLEKLWLKKTGEEKELIQGLIQLAVAYHHCLAHNNKGALKLFKRGLMRVESFEPTFLGLQLTELCSSIRTNINLLENSLDCKIESIVIAILPSLTSGSPET